MKFICISPARETSPYACLRVFGDRVDTAGR